MGLSKGDRTRRAMKTLFFLITMLISLLLLSAPVLLSITDALLPWAILSYSSLSPPLFLSLQSLSSHLGNYHFFYSLVDIPLISLVRSSVILLVYCFSDGRWLSRGPYLGIATACSVSSLVFVSLKMVSYGFDGAESGRGGGYGDRVVEVGLFLCSLLLAIGHVVVAHRTSCRERRKLLVYRIDIEAVSLIQRRSEVKCSKHTSIQ